ncbi:DUF4404 family protein [Prosthecobacter sp.]|uniref:DUF4404 family protein n=1 Tax=Prosthecobacter sp. TaxID=1965333 RepID=UPI003783AB07
MNSEQLQQLKTMVADAGDLPADAKAKLLELLDRTGETAANGDTDDAMGVWLPSVQEFEASHPEATGFMNRLATTLANMGI